MSWNRAASAADAPPANAPTNAPGRVTRPTVRVWSSTGRSASRIDWRHNGAQAWRELAPIESHASYSSLLVRKANRKARPANVQAIIVPPRVIPPRATT